jgi:hypothetical protein
VTTRITPLSDCSFPGNNASAGFATLRPAHQLLNGSGMKKLAVAFVLFLAACGAAPQAEEPVTDCSTCNAGEVCFTMGAEEACVPEENAGKVQSVTAKLPAPGVINKDVCMKILSRCTKRCPAGSVDCTAGCVDDFIDCVQS